VSDCAEALGLGTRATAAGLAPFHADPLRVVVGVAHPCRVVPNPDPTELDMLLKYVDATPPDSVCVVANDEDVQSAMWGGLMSVAAQQRGARGAVVDGGVRDLAQIDDARFAVFARYRSPLDIRTRGEIVAFGEPVSLRGVSVDPGDLVFADANGVVVIPTHAVPDVLALCEERAAKEATTIAELRAGAGAAEVYGRYEAF
jgi:4-hydroxy-4-methyl-2-oxoglutarate aldolase